MTEFLQELVSQLHNLLHPIVLGLWRRRQRGTMKILAHVNEREMKKEGRSKQGQSNNKAKQHMCTCTNVSVATPRVTMVTVVTMVTTSSGM